MPTVHETCFYCGRRRPWGKVYLQAIRDDDGELLGGFWRCANECHPSWWERHIKNFFSPAKTIVQ